MPLVRAFDDIKPDDIAHLQRVAGGQPASRQTWYFRASSDTPEAPMALLAHHEPGMTSSAHYHAVDQFQILVEGKGTFGRHDVMGYCVHFTRAYTPYGPLLADKKLGWTFLTLRARYDAGAQRVLEKLKQIPGRTPWQVTKKLTFPVRGQGVNLQQIDGIKDDQGLFVCTLTMAPHSQTTAPDPNCGDGQYIVVFKGSLIHEHKENRAQAVIFVKPGEPAFRIEAGAQGLEAAILNFPLAKPRTTVAKVSATAAGYKKWQCVLCAFAYDEALGMPDEGIPAGTRWEDVPETWNCPDCSANKNDFQMVEA